MEEYWIINSINLSYNKALSKPTQRGNGYLLADASFFKPELKLHRINVINFAFVEMV